MKAKNFKKKIKQQGLTPTPQRKAFGVSSDMVSERGFTLIELLVVVSIISLIASIIAVSTVNARRKARDSVRKADIKQLSSALELYFNDNASYPTTGIDLASMAYYSSDANSIAVPRPNDYIPGLVPKYLSKLPQDPLGGPSDQGIICNNGAWHREFLYRSDGRDYKLLSLCAMENGNFTKGDSLNDPARDGGPFAYWAGTNFSTPASDPNSPLNPKSCDDPAVLPGADGFSGGDGVYVWAYAVYSSPRSRCW